MPSNFLPLTKALSSDQCVFAAVNGSENFAEKGRLIFSFEELIYSTKSLPIHQFLIVTFS